MIEKTTSGGLLPQMLAPFQTLGSKLRELLVPASEASSDTEAYEIAIELPGVDSDDIDVTIEGDVLTVSGEKKLEREEKGDTWYFSERQYGAFSRSFRLPADADPSAVSADLKDGVLKLRIGRLKAKDGEGTRSIRISKG